MIFVDTNVIVDLTGPDQLWRDWSLDHLAEALERGPALIDAIGICRAGAGAPLGGKAERILVGFTAHDGTDAAGGAV